MFYAREEGNSEIEIKLKIPPSTLFILYATPRLYLYCTTANYQISKRQNTKSRVKKLHKRVEWHSFKVQITT